MTRDSLEFGRIDFVGDPDLLFGWRSRPRHVDAAHVSVAQSTFTALRSISEVTFGRLAERTAVDFGPYVEPDEDEYLRLQISDVPMPGAAGPGKFDADEVQKLSDVLLITAAGANLETISGDQVGDGHYLFYAVKQLTSQGEAVTCVKAMSPTTVLGRGRWFFANAGSLVGTQRPDIALAEDADVVITGDEILILNRRSFDRLFSDTDLTAAAVGASVSRLTSKLPKSLKIDAATEAALLSEGQRLSSLARRLERLSHDAVLAQLSPQNLRKALKKNTVPATDFIGASGSLSFGADRVKDFVDLVEGRWWTSDFSDELRRADRFRPRT